MAAKEKNKPMLDVMLETIEDDFFDAADRQKIKEALWIKEAQVFYKKAQEEPK